MDQGNAAVQRPGEAPPANPERWWTLAAVECGNFVVYMDGFIVTLALPAMALEFGVGLPVLKWVIVAYLLTVTVTLLPAGRLADIWGRRRIVVIGMGVLVVTSVLCALAPTVETLIAFRVLQGVGGGLVLANVMAEITAVFPKQERRKAMAVNASILALALFVAMEQRRPKPLLTLSLFRSRAFSFSSVAAAFYYVAAVSCYFLLPRYAQLVLGRSTVMAGVLIVRLSLVLLGMGGGLFHPPHNSATLNTVSAEHLSVANGFLTMARNFGQAIGAALAASLLAHGVIRGMAEWPLRPCVGR
ncbi:MAG: MFS transporter [Aphanothece saxicola GSE-SYN-MK-01-06B]|jgi:hypothetical protein|nr:MFS transporter [Aphanothece saxicola GSE-SYN-MK-01-06B]